MFERYSEKARRVIFFARYEASEFGSPSIDTEHLLLGILHESPGLLLSVVPPAEAETIREQIRLQVPVRDKIPTNVEVPFSASAKGVLNSATEEADRAESRTISVPHILVGLVREENCLAQRILMELGVTLDMTRQISAGWPEKGAGSHAFNPHSGVIGRAVPNEDFQRAIMDAMEEARLLRSPSARPEHLLLGLLRNESSLATRLLHEAGLDLESVRRKLHEN
jgi:ATP-dependent Clp protease ATP-binding subunit ClpC